MDLLGAVLVGLLMGAVGLALGLAVSRRRSLPPTSPSVVKEERRSQPLGALAAGIVHEVAQPLSAARVSIEGLHYMRQLGREPSSEQVARTLDRVGMSLVAMNQILDHLRYLAGGGQRSQLPVRLLDAAAALLADRGNWLRFTEVDLRVVDAGASPVQADPSGLRLVLANLVRNAAEAVANLPPERRWVLLRLGPGPQLQVEDAGPGIPSQVAGRLFEPYISNRGEARGVGLSLARAAVERMGGSVSFAPRAEGGTIFTVRLTPQPAPGDS